jgi:LuxR family maltose regulon positive regulatory protein
MERRFHQKICVLAEKTEGWAAGLQMAALYMQGRGDLSSFIMEFSGGHRYIMDYLIEEVLQRQSEEVQAFLLQTSILEKLNGSLCDMVTGQTNGQQMLELLENANMFIVPLDDRRGWYRYHRLFADLLKARLFESRPGIADKLHHRAAQWYANSGMMNEAVTHSLSAHDYEGTVNLLEQAAMPLLIRGELDTLDRWRLQIPQEILYMRPRLCVHLAWLSIFTGRIFDAELFLEHARNKLERNVSSVQSRDILGSIAAQSAFIADMRGDTACALDKVKEASGLLDKDNLTMRSVLPFVMARAYRLDGDLEGSLEQLGEVSGIARESGNILTLAWQTMK